MNAEECSVIYKPIMTLQPMDRKAHWEQTYRAKASHELGWYQAYPTLSSQLIESTGVGKSADIIDVGGGDSTLVDVLLDRGFTHVTVLDISSLALDRTKARLGARSRFVTWIEGDVTQLSTTQAYDVWHDRATFHFLTDAEDRKRYIQAMNRSVRASGHVIISTFAPDAPPTCNGLDVVRYSPQALCAEIGQGFKLIEAQGQIHITPIGTEQAFIYCHLKRPTSR